MLLTLKRINIRLYKDIAIFSTASNVNISHLYIYNQEDLWNHRKVQNYKGGEIRRTAGRLLFSSKATRIAVHTSISAAKGTADITEAEAETLCSRVCSTRLFEPEVENINDNAESLRRPILPRLRLSADENVTMALGFLIVTVVVFIDYALFHALGNACCRPVD